MRFVVTQLLRLIARVFFARRAVVGHEYVPTAGPVIFAINHPNGLIDPLCLFCLAPRPISMLAKSTLFSIPILGHIVRSMDSLPVYRRIDAPADTHHNTATFVAARNLLQRGGALAVFPEGVSHSDATLRPLKTGTARIALGAAAVQSADDPPLHIVVGGLHYTAKGTLRSSVLLRWGPPIAVPRVQLDSTDEPPADAVEVLTAAVARGLANVTLQPHDVALIPLLARAAAILTEDDGPIVETQALQHSVDLQQRLIAAHALLRPQHAAAVDALKEAIHTYDRTLDAHGIGVHIEAHLLPHRHPGRLWLRALGLAPLALVGIATHYATYRMVGYVALRRAATETDMVATLKVLGALLLYPITWLIEGAAMWPWLPSMLRPLLVLLPVCGYAALLCTEALEHMTLIRRRQRLTAALAPQRAAIVGEMRRLAAVLAGLP